jgi:hypothetical protein
MGAILNAVGAALCTIGTGWGTYGLYLMYVGDPSHINYIFLVGSALATAGGLVWFVSAIMLLRPTK